MPASMSTPSQAQAGETDQQTAAMRLAVAEHTDAVLTGQSPERIAELEAAMGGKPAESVVVEQSPETPEPETPAAEEAPAAETPATPEATAPAAEDPKRMRLEGMGERQAALALTMRRNPDMTPEEALAVVNTQFGAPQEPPAPVVPPQILDLEGEVSRIEALIDARGEAEGLVDKEYADLTKELSKANARLEAARVRIEIGQREAVREQAEHKEVEAEWNDSLKQAVDAYPDMRNRESAQWIIAAKLCQDANDPKHPDHAKSKEPYAPMFFATKAAQRLGKTAASAPAPVPSQPTVKTPAPAAGKQPAPVQTQKTEREVIQDSAAKTEAMLLGYGAGKVPVRGGLLFR